MNITTSKITGKQATRLAAEFAAISREQGFNVQFTHGGLFTYGTSNDLADLHVVAKSAARYFSGQHDVSHWRAAERIADKVAADYAQTFGHDVPGPAVHAILSLTGHGAATLTGGAS